jgi:hypothetical protein
MDRVALIQVHRAFDKALMRAGLTPTQRAQVHAKMRTAYPLSDATLDDVDDIEAQQLAALADHQLFDARTFLINAAATPGFAGRVDSEFGLPATEATATKQAGVAAAEWYAALYVGPPSEAAQAWVPSRLEYQFACATETGAEQTVLTASGYASGRLDWYAVDVDLRTATLGESSAVPLAPRESTLSMLPVPVSFAGMPSHRFWEMENRKVEFGALPYTRRTSASCCSPNSCWCTATIGVWCHSRSTSARSVTRSVWWSRTSLAASRLFGPRTAAPTSSGAVGRSSVSKR